MEAMHANAAGLMGQMAAAIAVLDMASGAGSFDESGQIKITADHVTVSRLQKTFFGSNSRSAQHVAVFTRSLVKMAFPIFHQVASRLVEICLQVRTIFRLPLDEDVTGPEAGQDVGDVPVRVLTRWQPLRNQFPHSRHQEQQRTSCNGSKRSKCCQAMFLLPAARSVSPEICCRFIVPNFHPSLFCDRSSMCPFSAECLLCQPSTSPG